MKCGRFWPWLMDCLVGVFQISRARLRKVQDWIRLLTTVVYMPGLAVGIVDGGHDIAAGFDDNVKKLTAGFLVGGSKLAS